jgi:uncharacterized LabA/DUF88 family protein
MKPNLFKEQKTIESSSISTPRYGSEMDNAGILFIDANNWYHNLKKYYNNNKVSIKNISNYLSKKLNINIIEIRWYTSIPDIEENEEIYFKHLKFLEDLKKKGIQIITRKLQKLKIKGQTIFKEKGIDVWIAVDIIRLSLIEKKCNKVVLISGDADFVPALELISKNKISVISSSVPKGYSYELRTKFPYITLNKEILDSIIKNN